ncbi:MAG: sugar ABC transporter permease [Clostridia bacterium]|nr:sugar ABC transporter permease [Clostridia bacterium]
MKKAKKMKGIEAIKEQYGWKCVSFWVVGILIFFIYPLIQSIVYMFCETELNNGYVALTFIKFENFSSVFKVDPDFTNNLLSSVLHFLYSFPAIMILSFILAVILNTKFKGRIFFRAIYFLPVIIASGVVYSTVLSGKTLDSIQSEASIASTIFSAGDIVESIGLPKMIGEYIEMVLSTIMDIVWKCGIQIVLFVSGMQSIPPALYEAANVEGATKWEEFWLITFPMMVRTLFLVAVFTAVDIITSVDDKVMSQAYRFMSLQNYGQSSSMLWVYFLIIGIFVAIVSGVFYKAFAKKWV